MNRATILALTVSTFGVVFPSLEDNLALDDRDEIFSGAARSGSAAMAYQDFWLEPMGSECLHDAEDYLDYEAMFAPTIFGVEIAPQMLDGFSLNTNGSLRLTLGFDGWAEGNVIVGAPPLLWGDIYGWASIHRCSGGIQEMCYACGRRHSADDGYACSHDSSCAARTSYANGCTCAPLLVKVNWDDDNWNLSEDRIDASLCTGDDETEGFRAIGVGKYCCCHGDISGTTSVSELTPSSELRLWNGSTAASSSASSFAIEAIAASSGIGGATISYEIRDETNGFLRAITRQVTAANLEIRPDFNDDGAVDNYDSFYFDDGGTWQLRVREEPYKFALVSECPSAATASLLAVQSAGTGTVIRTQATGGTTLPFGTPSSSPLFAAKNETKDLFVDTSNGPGTIYLHYSLGFGSAHAPLADTRQIHVVDANVREEWATTNSLPDLVYNFSDVFGDIYWTIYDDEDNIVDYGDDSSFTPIDLPPGNYTVEVYFADVYEDGVLGYTSSADLHVVTIEHSLLWETSNKANQILNTTYKDDYTGNDSVRETAIEGGRLCTYGVPRNVLYLVASNNAFHVTEKLSITPSNATSRILCAAFENDQPISGSCTNVNGFSEATMVIPFANVGNITTCSYEIRAGVDLNNDGLLSYSESTALKVYMREGNQLNAMIKGLSEAMYDDNDSYISGKVSGLQGILTGITLPVSRCFLSMFYNNSSVHLPNLWQPSIDTDTTILDAFADTAGFSEWLTHNSGAHFNVNGQAEIPKYIWWPNTKMSRFFERCSPFTPWVKNLGTRLNQQTGKWETYEYHTLSNTGTVIMNYFENELKSTAEALLTTATNGTCVVFSAENGWNSSNLVAMTFQSMSPTNVPGITVEIGHTGNYNGALSVLEATALQYTIGTPQLDNLDAFYAIGRGRIESPCYEIVAQKRKPFLGDPVVEIKEVSFSCTISDLYDFNFEDSDLSAKASTLQIGFGNGSSQRQCGTIYRHEIQIDATYANPFLQ